MVRSWAPAFAGNVKPDRIVLFKYGSVAVGTSAAMLVGRVHVRGRPGG
jgi:hypothetical protein